MARSVNFSGVIYDIAQRGYTDKNGNEQPITTLRFNVKDRIKVDGEWKTETVHWAETTAFGQTATQWANRYSIGHAIEVQGDLETHAWTKQDGTIGITQRITGVNGAPAAVRWCPRERQGTETAPTEDVVEPF